MKVNLRARSTEQTSGSNVRIDLPDPVIAAFIERIPLLPEGDRESLGPVRLRNIFTLPLEFMPRATRAYSRAAWLSFRAMSRAKFGSSPPIAKAYTTFFRQLNDGGWSWCAIGAVATGLYCLREREVDPASSILVYDLFFGRLLSREALGWSVAKTA